MEWKGKTVLVFGAGISGIGAAALLAKTEAGRVVIYDGNEKLDKENVLSAVAEQTGGNAEGIEIITGAFPEELYGRLDLAVLSPGIPTDIETVKQFRMRNIPAIGEIELAYTAGKGTVYAITGTNGKTTSTTLLGEIMKAAFPFVDVVGNIGNPYTEAAFAQTDETVTVAEISSFQLETIQTFHPKASAITNITPDHLNRHHTMEEYIRVKERICENQTKEDLCVLNYEDEVLRAFADKCPASVCFFSSRQVLDEGFCLDGDEIVIKRNGETIPLINVNDLKLLGLHNFENVMTAAAMAEFAGVDLDTIRKVLKEFAGVDHRISFVAEIGGVRYYNDSKGTNPDAAIKGIQAMNRPTLLIGGGYDKESTYEEWINCFDGKVKYFVLIGQTKEKIADAARRCGMEEEKIVLLENLKEAVDFCKAHAQDGDAVLLSPACASWGQFKNFEERGDFFKKYVLE